MCQHPIIHVNKNPGWGQCSSMDHCFCVSKQGVGLSLTSPPLKAHSWRVHLKKGDTVTQMATSTAPRTQHAPSSCFYPQLEELDHWED